MTNQWEQAYHEMEGCWELATAQVEYPTKQVRELEEALRCLVYACQAMTLHGPALDEARRLLGLEVKDV